MPYIITGWLEKNKDPLNDTVVQLLGGSKDPLVASLFAPVQGKFCLENSPIFSSRISVRGFGH